jgi:hypothetical protein
MKKITSLADFFRKADRDNRYRKLAVYCQAHSGWGSTYPSNWKSAQHWIDEWVRTNMAKHNPDASFDCSRMVRYLNNNIMNISGWNNEEAEPIPDPPTPIVPPPPTTPPAAPSTITNA